MGGGGGVWGSLSRLECHVSISRPIYCVCVCVHACVGV